MYKQRLAKRRKQSHLPNMLKLTGLIPAVFTPMLENGEVNYDKIINYASHLSLKGVDTVFVCGSTGEFSSLSVTERKKVLEEWIRARKAGLIKIVVAHIGHCNINESIELAKHAAEVDADAFSAVPPWYFPIVNIDSLLETTQKIAQSVPNKPFLFYHIPLFIQSSVNIVEFMKQAASTIPNLIGMKFSYSDLGKMFECSQIKGQNGETMQVLLGMDDLCLPAKVLGITNGIGATYNFMIDFFQRIEVHYGNGDMASGRAETKHVQKILAICMQSPYGMIAVFKCIMALAGMDLGPPRLPLRRLSKEDERTLAASLKEIGLIK